ncbi:MAG TPA: selenocysteine-specific translation elongation factor [Stellaceae bacterium]|nr:selenocysteine-specific translation elongation factor [Stellaceae bacterium]
MILATAGHIDHGKTALVHALTGVDADRLPEEKRRGLTIDLGFAYATLPDGARIGFVDVPGHERFLPNMLAGVLSIDRVLLVVAADDGPRPQTIEHLDILELIEVAEITAVITKIDRVASERLAAVRAETDQLLSAAGYAGSPIFAVSSRTGDGIAPLIEHLQRAAAAVELSRATSSPHGLFRMPIDRVFTLPGIGLVVTGSAAAGTVAVDDRLLVSPRGVPVRVRGLHAQNRSIEKAAAGERCAVNIVGSFPEGGEPRRGDWLLAPERHQPARRLDLAVRASRHAATALRDGLPVHLHLGTEDVVGRVAVLSGRSIAAGETGFVQIDIDQPIGALHGDRVVLRDHASRQTLAGGRVVDPFAPRRGRRLPTRLAMLAAMAPVDPAVSLAGMLAAAGVVDLANFALIRNLAPAELDALTADGQDKTGFLRIGPARAPVAVTTERLAALGETIIEALASWHRRQPDMLGPSRPALVERLRGEAPAAALDAALAVLAETGRVAQGGGLWHLPEHRPRLTRADETLWQQVRPMLDSGELRPPRVREIAAALTLEPAAVERLLRRVERLGQVAKIADNRYFLPETVARLGVIARELADASPEGSFTAAMFKDRSGIGRNLTISVLEHLDRIGTTRREGGVRTVLPSRRGFE